MNDSDAEDDKEPQGKGARRVQKLLRGEILEPKRDVFRFIIEIPPHARLFTDEATPKQTSPLQKAPTSSTASSIRQPQPPYSRS